MNALWTYFWPSFAAGAAVGILAGAVAYRRPRTRIVALVVGAVASLLLAALWHGPLGGADRFAAWVEREVRQTLVYYQISQVSAHLQRSPLRREILLSGLADDFQRSELVRYMGQIPGVGGASWSSRSSRIPLIVEGLGVALLGFLLGLLVAYLVELRRRYNAQWNW